MLYFVFAAPGMLQKKQTVIFSSGNFFTYAFFRLAIFSIGIDFFGSRTEVRKHKVRMGKGS